MFLRMVGPCHCNCQQCKLVRLTVNPLPHMPMLGSSNAAANKDMMSKIMTIGDKIF